MSKEMTTIIFKVFNNPDHGALEYLSAKKDTVTTLMIVLSF